MIKYALALAIQIVVLSVAMVVTGPNYGLDCEPVTRMAVGYVVGHMTAPLSDWGWRGVWK